jgi:AcrR family transcriptional regulator
LSPELVERNQRERLIAAMAEVCGEGGYAAATVAEVARRAGVSTASFYRQFKDRRECMLVSFEELFGRLLGEIERVCASEEDSAKKLKAAVAAAASLLAADPPTARLLTVEISAAGPEGVRLQHRAIERLAALLPKSPERDVGQPHAQPTPEWIAATVMVTLVAKRVLADERPDAGELEAVCDAL